MNSDLIQQLKDVAVHKKLFTDVAIPLAASPELVQTAIQLGIDEKALVNMLCLVVADMSQDLPKPGTEWEVLTQRLNTLVLQQIERDPQGASPSMRNWYTSTLENTIRSAEQKLSSFRKAIGRKTDGETRTQTVDRVEYEAKKYLPEKKSRSQSSSKDYEGIVITCPTCHKPGNPTTEVKRDGKYKRTYAVVYHRGSRSHFVSTDLSRIGGTIEDFVAGKYFRNEKQERIKTGNNTRNKQQDDDDTDLKIPKEMIAVCPKCHKSGYRGVRYADDYDGNRVKRRLYYYGITHEKKKQKNSQFHALRRIDNEEEAQELASEYGQNRIPYLQAKQTILWFESGVVKQPHGTSSWTTGNQILEDYRQVNCPIDGELSYPMLERFRQRGENKYTKMFKHAKKDEKGRAYNHRHTPISEQYFNNMATVHPEMVVPNSWKLSQMFWKKVDDIIASNMHPKQDVTQAENTVPEMGKDTIVNNAGNSVDERNLGQNDFGLPQLPVVSPEDIQGQKTKGAGSPASN